MTPKVLTGFTDLDDGELDLAASTAVTSLTDNGNFTLGTSLADFTDAEVTYHGTLASLNTGGKAATQAKNDARAALLPLFSNVAIMVNQQAEGNKTMLLSSGIPLVSDNRQHHQQPLPVNLQVANGPNGSIIISVKHSPVGDHGTVFAYTPADSKITDPDQWMQKSVNGHKIAITGLTQGSIQFYGCV
jgi:hypothetical protein